MIVTYPLKSYYFSSDLETTDETFPEHFSRRCLPRWRRIFLGDSIDSNANSISCSCPPRPHLGMTLKWSQVGVSWLGLPMNREYRYVGRKREALPECGWEWVCGKEGDSAWSGRTSESGSTEIIIKILGKVKRRKSRKLEIRIEGT